MKMKKTLLKKIIFIIILIYAVVTFVKQQKVLNNYAAQEKDLQSQIAEANEYQQQLNEEKENVNSTEYIEAIAREKLDMYLPNERVYVDNEN
jgi:cell division protein FtsL